MDSPRRFLAYNTKTMKQPKRNQIEQLAARVNNISSKLAAEPKYYQVYSSGSMANTGTVVPITNLAQGDSVSSRDGNQVKTSDVLIRFKVEGNATYAATQAARLIVVQDLQQVNATNPTPSDLMAVVTGDVTEAPFKIGTVGRFRVLADKRLSLVSTHTISGEIRIKISSIVRYSSTASSDITKNGIYLFYFSNFNTSNMPQLSCWSQLKYYDN